MEGERTKTKSVRQTERERERVDQPDIKPEQIRDAWDPVKTEISFVGCTRESGFCQCI